MGGPSTCALGGGQKHITEGIKKAGNEILCRTEESIQNKVGKRESHATDMAYQQSSSTSSVKTITNCRTNWEIKVKKLYLNNLILAHRFVKDRIISDFNNEEITVIYLAILPLEGKKSGWISKLQRTSFLPNSCQEFGIRILTESKLPIKVFIYRSGNLNMFGTSLK
jgi:hypothetical protein